MKNKNNLIKIVILATIFGLGAGLVGQLFTTAYLLPKETLVLGGNGKIKKSTTQTEENEKISEAHRTVSPTIFAIYPEKDATRDIFNQIYLPKERQALGVILTSDGWLLSFGRSLADSKNRYVIATSDQKIFSPQKILFDEATEAVFIKIEAQNLPVPKLNESSNLALGEKLIVSSDKQTMQITEIKNLAYKKMDESKNLLRSSEKFSKFILLNGILDLNEIGAPAINLDGEIVGIAAGTNGEILSINFWQTAFFSVLKNNQIKRPYLGVNYIDLATAPGLNEAISQNQITGALVWGEKNLQINSVEKNSPAESAGLRLGDIILKINNEEILTQNDLTELVQKYVPGNKIELTILRAGEKKTLEVTLGEKL